MYDIKTAADIKKIILAFYEKIKGDETLGYIFTDIAKVDWDHHLPIMFDFWEFTVLGTGTYKRNVMTPHFILNEKIKLQEEHFNQWLKLFTETVDEFFEGENADEMKKRAGIIAATLMYKLGERDKLNII